MASDPALMREWELLQRELAAVKCLSTSFKNRQYVAKYRGQQLKPEKEYAAHVADRFRDPEFTPFAWPLLEAACKVGDEETVSSDLNDLFVSVTDVTEYTTGQRACIANTNLSASWMRRPAKTDSSEWC